MVWYELVEINLWVQNNFRSRKLWVYKNFVRNYHIFRLLPNTFQTSSGKPQLSIKSLSPLNCNTDIGTLNQVLVVGESNLILYCTWLQSELSVHSELRLDPNRAIFHFEFGVGTDFVEFWSFARTWVWQQWLSPGPFIHIGIKWQYHIPQPWGYYIVIRRHHPKLIISHWYL